MGSELPPSPPKSPLTGQSYEGCVVSVPFTSLILFVLVSREKQSKRKCDFFLMDCIFLELFFIRTLIVVQRQLIGGKVDGDKCQECFKDGLDEIHFLKPPNENKNLGLF